LIFFVKALIMISKSHELFISIFIQSLVAIHRQNVSNK